jgi:hypothetical protein
MGIINHDTYITRWGQPITDMYISLKHNPITLQKQEDIEDPVNGLEVFVLNATFHCYISKDYSITNPWGSHFETIVIELKENDPFTGDVYDLAYQALKERFPNYTDC